MGKVNKHYADKLVSPIPDRNANRIRVYDMDNGELVIHFRNFKINLLSQKDREEWVNGFREALKKLREGDYFKNDI